MASIPSERPQKRRRVTPRSAIVNDDNLSRLPDEILSCHILPKLNTRNAASTTILSRRWQNLWIHDIPHTLVFRYSPDSKFYKWPYLITKARSMITDAINRILKTHYTKPTLDELTICFNFDSSSSGDIDTWLELAFEKGIKRLELDFTNSNYDNHDIYRSHYTFPSIEKLSSQHMQAGIINLRELYLKSIRISSEQIEFLVSNCFSLEHLSLLRPGLANIFKTSIRTTKLKRLELDVWSHIKIWASNLVSLHSSDPLGGENRLIVEHAPNLSELSLGGTYCNCFLQSDVKDFPVSQLKTLKLDVPYLTPDINIKCPSPFPIFAKLEKLEVKMMVTEDTNFYSLLIILIQAAPLLQRFSINPIFTQAIEKVPSEVKKAFKQMNRLQSLKSVELRRQSLRPLAFGGDGHEYNSCLMELCMHLMHVSNTLEEFVIIDNPYCRFKRLDMDRLIKFLPPGVELVHL